MKYHVEGLRTVMVERTEPSIVGKLRVRYLMFVCAADPVPTLIVAAAMLVGTNDGWVIGHVLVEDDARRQGWAEKIVLAIEREHGHCGAIWCTEAGEAFARKFVEKHGPRPWRIGGYPEVDALFETEEAGDVRRPCPRGRE